MPVLLIGIHMTLVRMRGRDFVVVLLVIPYFIYLVGICLYPIQNFWVKEHKQIYLLGNPFVWYLSTLAVLAYAGARGILILRQQRGFRDFENSKSDPPCIFVRLSCN